MSAGRLFVGVRIPLETAVVLAGELRRWAGDEGLPGRIVPPENWHLTIRFLGPVDEVARDLLVAGLDGAELGRRFPLTLSGMGAFPKPRRATVLWVGVADPRPLEELAGIVERAVVDAGLGAGDRPFVAHLTVSRIRPEADIRDLLARTPPPPVRFTVGEVTLFESHLGEGAPRYEEIERFPLR